MPSGGKQRWWNWEALADRNGADQPRGRERASDSRSERARERATSVAIDLAATASSERREDREYRVPSDLATYYLSIYLSTSIYRSIYLSSTYHLPIYYRLIIYVCLSSVRPSAQHQHLASIHTCLLIHPPLYNFSLWSSLHWWGPWGLCGAAVF